MTDQMHPERETGLADQEESDDTKVTTERVTERTTSEPAGDNGDDEEDK